MLRWIMVFLMMGAGARAQISPAALAELQAHERELAALSFRIVNDSAQEERADACFKFIPRLVEALKLSGSFHYPFDSLETISIVKPADNTFRIFTWQLRWGNGLFRHYGAIQMNNPPRLKMFPLFDYSDSLMTPASLSLDQDHWLGALYYNIYEFNTKAGKRYLLFGFDQNDLWSSKKLIDVLYFNEKGHPVFGAPVFEMTDTSGNVKLLHRFILEYKKDAITTLNYSAADKMIVFDHLVAPEQRLADMRFTYIPDGTYEGFRLKKGRWVHVEKIKTINIGRFDDPPVPVPKQ